MSKRSWSGRIVDRNKICGEYWRGVEICDGKCDGPDVVQSLLSIAGAKVGRSVARASRREHRERYPQRLVEVNSHNWVTSRYHY